MGGWAGGTQTTANLYSYLNSDWLILDVNAHSEYAYDIKQLYTLYTQNLERKWILAVDQEL